MIWSCDGMACIARGQEVVTVDNVWRGWHLFGGAGRHSGFGGVFWGRWRQPRNRLVDLESVCTRKNRRYCLRGRLYGEPLGRGLQGGGLAVVGAQVEKCTSWCRRNLRFLFYFIHTAGKPRAYGIIKENPATAHKRKTKEIPHRVAFQLQTLPSSRVPQYKEN